MRSTFLLCAWALVGLFQISSGSFGERQRGSRPGSYASSEEQAPASTDDAGHGGQEIARSLLRTYMSNVSPGKTTVELGAGFICAQLDETNGALTAHIHLYQMWSDWRLKWSDEVAKRTGIRTLNLWSWNVWIPDITQYNGYDKKAEHDWTNVVVVNSGRVVWVPKVNYYTLCAKHARNDGVFNCTLKLGSWTSDTDQIDLKLSEGSDGDSASRNYIAECPYVVNNVVTRIHSQIYECCPDAPYDSFVATFDVRRRH